MSWDAELYAVVDGHEVTLRAWNHTHNCNPMIRAALEPFGLEWWDDFTGLTGKDGAEYLAALTSGLEADPDKFRAMDPANGWGSYDTLLDVLTDMWQASNKFPTARWRVSG